jgi:hypothetical protein
MLKPFYIYRNSNFHHSVEGGLPSLKADIKKLCGKNIRRIDRFTQLSLIGSLQCKGNIILPDKTGIYLASKYGPLNNTSDVLSQIYQQGQIPKPINFINAVSNTACYYLAELLDLSASNQFVTSKEFSLAAGLKLASFDLEGGRVEAALVGLVCEVDKNLEFHRQRISLGDGNLLAEGSHWLYVAYDLPDQKPLAKVTTIAQPISEDELYGELNSLFSQQDQPISVGFSNTIKPEQRANILSKKSFIECDFSPLGLQHDFPDAFQIHGFLEQKKYKQFIYIDKNANDFFSMIVIELLC